MNSVVLRASKLDVETTGGRALFRGLNLSLERDAVAIVGRNGVGKSTLLRVLAGVDAPTRGSVECGVTRAYVPQRLVQDGIEAMSPGEGRRSALEAALGESPELLILDEPTRDLDLAGAKWLEDRLSTWRGGLLVASHREAILRHFVHFFVATESGCRYFDGTFEELREDFERRREREEYKYATRLQHLEAAERRNETILRRRRRKKNLGRLHELGRNPSRAQLGKKKCYAEESQGRAAKIRAQRIELERAKGSALRRALAVDLPLSMTLPALPPHAGPPLLDLRDISLERRGRVLFWDINLCLSRERVAIVGPNGAGKSSLVDVALGTLAPSSGMVRAQHAKIGVITQGATNWQRDDSLLSLLLLQSGAESAGDLAGLLHAHRFPFALAERPLSSLSPGERTRAALLCLCHQTPAIELLVLDEPTSSLDFLGIASLTASLQAWRGGLLVVSHDADFLRAINVERRLAL